MRSLVGARHEHRRGTLLDTSQKKPLYDEEWQPGTTTELRWPCPGGGCRTCVTFVSLPLWWCEDALKCTGRRTEWRLCVSVCTRAGITISSVPGWGEWPSVQSLERSLFTLMNTTPTPLQPIAKRAFAYWQCSKAGNHRGYEYTWEQCLSFWYSEQFLWMLTCLLTQTLTQ